MGLDSATPSCLYRTPRTPPGVAACDGHRSHLRLFRKYFFYKKAILLIFFRLPGESTSCSKTRQEARPCRLRSGGGILLVAAQERKGSADRGQVEADDVSRPIKRWFALLWIGVWASGVVLLGAVLTSFHQPFRAPEGAASELALLGSPGSQRQPMGWRAIHVISGSCGCSQRVMQHLLLRGAIAGVGEQVVVMDGKTEDLPGSEDLMARLDRAGFPVTHAPEEEMARRYGVHGVPLLIVIGPDEHVVYMGGYGPHEDQDNLIVEQVRAGHRPRTLPIVGCAVSAGLRQQVDPFHLKY